jgi:hypothetical protein
MAESKSDTLVAIKDLLEKLVGYVGAIAQGAGQGGKVAPAASGASLGTCAGCNAVLTTENSSKSAADGRIIHIGCKVGAVAVAKTEPKKEEAKTDVVSFDALKEFAIKYTKEHGKEDFAKRMEAFGGAKKLSEIPEAKRKEFIESFAKAAVEDDLLG